MIAWIGDFFRFWWALFYWNSRKSWFRLGGAHRDDCPCQNFSDSGIAYQSRCDAVIPWHQPARFRRVCPLLTETPEGWRCSVEAERVRPFWGRALLYAVGALLALYLAGTAVAYATLRAAKYDLSYLVVAWPPRWKELRGAQEKLYVTRAQTALARGNYQEAILSLEMVCQLNPRNYSAGLALAGLTQMAAQPHISEHIYERLMHDVHGVVNHGRQTRNHRQIAISQFLSVNWQTIVDTRQHLVFFAQHQVEFLAKNLRVEEILNAQSNPQCLVGIRGPDAAFRRAELVLAEVTLGERVHLLVIRHDHVGVARKS